MRRYHSYTEMWTDLLNDVYVPVNARKRKLKRRVIMIIGFVMGVLLVVLINHLRKGH